uniref:Uncharacterized protein n=1 Tax=Rhinopithecus bieti TaxID=61621 RepID=A0A2K6JUG9_RHIBE
MNKKEHLNWSGYLESNVFKSFCFLIKSDATVIFGSMYGNVCTYVKSQANYKLLQNRSKLKTECHVLFIRWGGEGKYQKALFQVWHLTLM